MISTGPAAALDVLPLGRDHVEAYGAFAREAFGPNAYQAEPGFLAWLYERSPVPDTHLGRAKIAVVGSEVVGCMHAMHLPWRIGDGVEIVSTPSNLVVAEAHRRGAGLALISECFRGERHLLLLGAAPSVQPIYERMGARPLRLSWLRTPLQPASAPLVAALDRFAPRALDACLAQVHRALDGRSIGRGAIRIDAFPTHDDLSEVAAQLVANAGARAHVAWDAPLIRWRFFDRDGPRHLLVRVTRPRATSSAAAAVVSLGVHRRLAVGRIVAWSAADASTSLALAVAVRAVLTVGGANACVATTSDDAQAGALRRTGFFAVEDAPRAYELHRPRSLAFGEVEVEGGASDAGFDALPRRR